MAREQPGLHFLYREITGLSRYAGTLNVEELRARFEIAPKPTGEDLSGLQMPVLFVTGSEDVVFPGGGAEAMAALIPESTVHNVPKTGHSVYFERPDTFNQLVHDFLRTVPG